MRAALYQHTGGNLSVVFPDSFSILKAIALLLILICPRTSSAFTNQTDQNSHLTDTFLASDYSAIEIMADPNTISISGNVVTPEGEGLAVAELLLEVNGQQYREWSGPNGEFLFQNIPSNLLYQLTVKKSGHRSQLFSGSTSSDLEHEITLQAHQYVLSGNVVTPDNEPLEGIVVDGGALGTATTDQSGNFSFQVTYGMQYKLVASEMDYYFLNNGIEGTVQGDVKRLIVGDLD